MPSLGTGDRRCIGIILLVVVNILWVLSSELTSFIFIDEEFRRPFFTVYVKTCLLCIYFIRYLFCSPSVPEHKYKILEESDELLEMDEISLHDALEVEGFETVSSISESENEQEESVSRRIRFSDQREVRRLPSSEAEDAQRARLPYSDTLCCTDSFVCSPRIKYAVLFFAPMAILVIMNLAGVLVVSQFSTKLTGAVLAQISAISYAVYLVMYARFMDRYGEIDMNLMFGSVGLLGVFIGSPLILILDATGYEKLHPLPNTIQLGSIVVSAMFGTLLADYLWLMAAGMTDSVSASLSLTLSIPLSFLADSLMRNSPPSFLQILAAIPITLSFIGAALVDRAPSQTRAIVPEQDGHDQESLLAEEDDQPGHSCDYRNQRMLSTREMDSNLLDELASYPTTDPTL